MPRRRRTIDEVAQESHDHARLVEGRIALQVNLLGGLFAAGGAFFALAAWLGLFTTDATIVGTGALLFPIGAGLLARSSTAAWLAVLAAGSAILIALVAMVLYVSGSGAFDFAAPWEPQSEAITARLVDTAFACILPLWALRVLWLAFDLRLFESRSLLHPDRARRLRTERTTKAARQRDQRRKERERSARSAT